MLDLPQDLLQQNLNPLTAEEHNFCSHPASSLFGLGRSVYPELKLSFAELEKRQTRKDMNRPGVLPAPWQRWRTGGT